MFILLREGTSWKCSLAKLFAFWRAGETVADNEKSSRDYYYHYEVAEKLHIPVNDVWRMKLPNRLRHGGSVFPKELVDKISNSWSEVLCSEYEEKYYMLEQFAVALMRDSKEFVDRATIFYEQYWIPEEEAEQIIEIIASRQRWRDKTIRERLPNPTSKRDAEKQSAEFLTQRLRAKIDKEKQSAESRIQAIQEKFDKERVAKEQKAEDARDFERWLDEAQAKLDGERNKNNRLMEGRQNDKGTISTQLEQEKQRRKDAEQRAQELHSELEEEKTIRPDTEQRFNDLKATLDRSEAERKELEGALSQEKEKASHLEADANLLTEIRRLLGASLEQTKNAAEATPVTPSPPPEEIIESPVEEMPETLTIKTHSGETVIFRPPFALSSREVELIKLVAGEDEITAE